VGLDIFHNSSIVLRIASIAFFFSALITLVVTVIAFGIAIRELEQRLQRHLKPTKGRWCYLYRAIDSKGATIDFLLSALRDADAAKRLFRKALGDRSHPQPRVINTDLAPIYNSAIPDSKRKEHCAIVVDTDPCST
jgi:transposase-like protein